MAAATDPLGPNADLIGQQGSRFALNTPALIIDLDSLERNIEIMAGWCRDRNITLRPHTKTHKSVAIAKRQLAAGAVGICCAKLAEAEAMHAGGIDDILITSPVVTAPAIKRLMALNLASQRLIAVVDHPDVVQDLAHAAEAAGKTLRVIIDVDVGLHRTGIAPGEGLIALAKTVYDTPWLECLGLQAYAGHVMHEHHFDSRRDKSRKALALLKDARSQLGALGLYCELLTGGGTGTFDIDPDENILTEIQAGSYVFMDQQYNDVLGADESPLPFGPSLFVQTSVISVNTPGLATTDAGFKVFATDADTPAIWSGAPEGASYMYFGDEQGLIVFADQSHRLALGDQIVCLTPHCDPTVNLHRHYHCVRGDTLVDIWPIDARGFAQ